MYIDGSLIVSRISLSFAHTLPYRPNVLYNDNGRVFGAGARVRDIIEFHMEY